MYSNVGSKNLTYFCGGNEIKYMNMQGEERIS